MQRSASDACAVLSKPRASWHSIVLPEPQQKLLRELAATARRMREGEVCAAWGQGMHRATPSGLCALFVGPPGTGKTFAAEVVDADLRLALVRVDLSTVISKYIGETEKNLARAFSFAAPFKAVLLLDDADALFGSRTEVRDAHDRYANIETGYLLQRIEVFRGLVIVTTNTKQQTDAAFLRRTQCVIEFLVPTTEQRRAIWQSLLPPDTALSEGDFNQLQLLELTGGGIRNVVLRAAALAAERATAVGMPIILEAARRECEAARHKG